MQPVANKINYRSIILDVAERVILAALFGYFAFHMLGAWLETGGAFNLLLLISEGSVVVFAIMRRYTRDVSARPLDWLFAFLGTLAPLLVLPSVGAALVPGVIFLPIMVIGLGLQIAAKLILRRSFGVVAANRGVKIAGPYRFVRHPMYAGYMLTQCGYLLANPTAWNVGVYAFAWAFAYVRIVAEEKLLIQDSAYRQFTKEVRYRVIPGVI